MSLIYRECPKCDGEGSYEVSDAPFCRRPASECCGGCGHVERCDRCGGLCEVVAECSECRADLDDERDGADATLCVDCAEPEPQTQTI